MKTHLLPLCAAFMFCALASAQQPGMPTQLPAVAPLSENYVLTLTITDKEQADTKISLVVGSTNFRTDFVDSKYNVSVFQGTITPNEGGTVSVMYALGGSIGVPTSTEKNASMNYRSVSTQTTVILKLDEPVQIIKSDARTCTLTVSKLSEQTTKGK